MFGRLVTIKLKMNSAGELARINQTTIVPLLHAQKGSRNESLYIDPWGSEAIAKSSWDTKENAEAYDLVCYPRILMALALVVDGKPTVETYEFVGSGFQQAMAKAS
ncbi:MAG TPA: hypothetical protein VFQ43_09120 [Nitrososphaera sp.]|nr:hypothetical protein [Nitrososphaera sp.]